MKKIYLTSIIVFVTMFSLSAQSRQAPKSRAFVEKGTSGDLILAKRIKMQQLKAPPVVLEQPGPARKKKGFVDRQHPGTL